MGCYLGCATKRNKIMWGLFALLLLLGGILIAIGLSRIPACRRGLPQQCYAGGSTGSFVELTDEACRVAYAACIRPWLIMAGVGLVGLASALVVTCAMCCCNKPPKAAPGHLPPGGVQMTAAPINPYQQQQQQQQHLPAHHPYAAGGPYGQPQQPPGGYPPYPVQQQQPWQGQQQPQQQPWQQPQQGTPFAPTGSHQQQQPLAPYPPMGKPGSSNVPVQQF